VNVHYTTKRRIPEDNTHICETVNEVILSEKSDLLIGVAFVAVIEL
jgi:hypothetical protein